MANVFDQFDQPAQKQGSGSSFYDDVRKAISPHGGRITSTSGGRHNVGSAHYSGRAVDVGMGRETREQQELIKASLEAAGYRVRDERTRPRGQAVWSGPHLHVTRPDDGFAASITGGSGGGGGGGSYPTANAFDQFEAPAGGNPFDQFDAPAPAPDITQAFRQQRADREIAARPRPDFSNVTTEVDSTQQIIPPLPQDMPVPTDGDYRSVFAPEDQSTFGKIGLRALIGRVPTLAGNLIDLPGNLAGAVSDALPGDSMTATLLRETFNRAGQAVRDVGFEREMEAAGYGAPSVSGSQVVEAVNPMADVPLLERAARVGRFIPETLLASSPDMAAAIGALPAYIGARTNEVAENRAANDMREDPSLTDLLIAAPTATAESALERFTTMRLLPGGTGAAVRPGAAAAGGRVLRETGLQGTTGAVEEALPYLAERVGTETPVTQQGLVESLVGGLLAEGGLGGGVQGTSEIARAFAPNAPAALPPIQEPVPQAAAAEGVAAPRQGEAPAAPPAPVRQEAQQAPEAVPPAPVEAAAPPRPDMAAATRSIDDRLAALDEAAAAQIEEAEVSALNAERQELDDLVREQDRARREGIVQPLEARLSPEERATADARRQEIAATLERHRAARSAADQANRLRSRLEGADTDAALYDIAREINPTLGTPQAQAFRAPTVEPEKINNRPAPAQEEVMQVERRENPRSAAVAQPAVEHQQPTAGNLGTGQTSPNVAERSAYTERNVGELQRAPAASAPPAAPRRAPETPEAPATAPEVAPAASEAPRAEAQRQPAAEPVPGQTSLKNVVTDAERIAEGRDPIIREARKANRETVDEAVDTLRKTPSIGRETAERLANGGPVELKDEAVLLVHKVDLRKRRDAAAERAQDPNASEDARATARKEYDDLVQQIDTVDQAAVRVGTESGRLLQLRKRMIAEDYSLPALERNLRMVVNRELKPAERAELSELAEKVATLQRRLDAAESQQASAQVAEMLGRLMKQAPGRGATLEQRRAAAAESRAALSAMAAGRTPQRSIPDTPYDAALKIRRARAREMRAEGGSLADYADSEHAYWLRGGKLRANGRLTLYRAVRPGGSIQPGDYVTNSRAYAAQHLRHNLGGDGEILSVDGWSDEIFPADGPGEFWYAPRSLDAPESVSQRSLQAGRGEPGQARAALAERLGRGVVARLERAGVLEFDDRNGGTWDGVRIGIGNVAPENALGVLLHEVSHANMLDVMGEQGYERALRDLDKLEASGDMLALRAKRRADKSGEAGQRLDDERIAYMVEEATNAQKRGVTVSEKAGDFLRSVMSAFRRWAATSPVFRALERVGVNRPTLRPDDFVAFARRGLDRMVEQARQPATAAAADRIRKLEGELRTDQLTGLRNKRAFDEDASLGWPSVVAIDMDGLKRLNDAIGHEAADDVMRALADELRGAEGDGARFYRRSGDEFAARFRDPADAEAAMQALQQALEGIDVELDVADDAGAVRSYTYQGIGISYGTGATYETADAAANRQKADRLAAGLREAPRTDGPSRRLRESPARPGGRRAGDPQAVGAQRSVPEGEADAGAPVPAGADPVAFFHLAQLGAFHYADGAQDIGEWMRRMEADLGAAAGRFRGMLPDAFKASKAQASKPVRGQESVAEAVEAIGDQRRPRDVKRVVRAVVSEGMRGEAQVFEAAADALGMDAADVRALFVQPEPGPKTLSEAQAEITRLRNELRAAQRPDPETRYQNQRARDFQRRIAELEERIAAGDFAKRERVERELRTENQRLQFELEKAKERFHQYAIRKEFEQRSPIGKIFGHTVHGINFARAIMTSLDLSAVLRQGGFITLGNPGRATKGIVPMFRAFASERADFEAMQEIQNRQNAPLYKKYGLQLTGIGGDALTRVEEAYASRWVDQWSKWAGGGLIRGSGRAYTAFLNRLRADSFDAMLAALARNGEKPTKEEGEAIANYINVATGRGSLGGKNPGEVLTAVFFAPRLVASRFELLAGQPLYGGSNRTRAMILKEYARFLAGVGVVYALAAMAADDEERKQMIELDPRSVNFGKIKFGDTYIDPLVGLAQVTTFSSRILTGEERETKTGRLIPLRDNGRLTDYFPQAGDGVTLPKVQYKGKHTGTELIRFLRTKLAPVPGGLVTQVFANQKNMIGEKETPLETAGGLVTPMSVGNLVDVLEEQGMARGTAINLLGILGMGVQYRKSDAEKAAEAAGGVPGMLTIGRAPETADGE